MEFIIQVFFLDIDIALLYSSKTIGATTIQSGYPGWGDRGSGMSLFMYNFIDQMPRQTAINARISEIDNDGSHLTIIGTMVHELTHYFFGVGHFGSIYLGEYFGSTRSGSNIGPYASNSGGYFGTIMGYEKIRLGWIEPQQIKTVTINTTVTLQDLTSWATGYKIIKIPLDADQSIFLENRSWVNPYETRYVFEGFGKPLNPGILAYLIPYEYDYLSSTAVQQICADGKWDWVRLSGSGMQNPNDVIAKSNPNSFSGYDEKERIFIPAHPLGQWLAHYFPNGYGSVYGRWYKGDNYLDETHNTSDYQGDYKDLFTLGHVVTKFSNPATHKRSSINTSIFEPTEIGIEIQSYSAVNSSYTIEIRLNQRDLLAPLKPQNAKIEVYTGGGKWNPKITWAAMSEPEVTTGGSIYVERSKKLATGYWTTWLTIATLAGIATQYIDLTFSQSGSGNDSLKYRVRAKDSQNKYSVYSDEVKINYMQYAQKRGIVEKIPMMHALLQNFPNPFNPSTTFRFELPNDEYITLKVFDMLGKEKATVVNGFRQKGYYEEQFDASLLPSGMYMYRLTAGSHSSSRKMMLMK